MVTDMHFLFFIIVALINSGYSKEFIATDFGKNELVRVDDEFQPNKTYDFAIAGVKIDGFQARYVNNDKLMLIWLNNSELSTRYMDSKSLITLTNINFKLDLNNFDVQSCGDHLVMISLNGDLSSLHLGNFKDGSYSQIISYQGNDIRSATLHPTKLIVYYTLCKGATFSFKIYDVDAKKELDSFVPPACLDAIAYDERNDILWAADGNLIYKSNLRDHKFEMVKERETGIISSIAVGSQDLFVMYNDGRRATVDKFKLSPNVSLQLQLPSFKIKPVMGTLKGGKIYILDIENASLSVYDKQFNNKEWTTSIEVNKKPIVSVQGLVNSDDNVELYWTHDANNGEMEMVVANAGGVVEGSRQTLEFPVPNIVDFSIYGRDSIMYMISGTKIYICNVNNSVMQQNVSEVFNAEVPLTGIATSLTIFATFCTENDQGVFTISPSRGYTFLKSPLFQCFQRVYYDLSNLFFSSKNGIYTDVPRLQNIEKLGDVLDQMNLVVVDQVYFIDDLSETGAGVYKIPKSRSTFTWNSMASFPKNFVTEIKGGCDKNDTKDETEESSPKMTTNNNQYSPTGSPSQTTVKNAKSSSPIGSAFQTAKNSNSKSTSSSEPPSQTTVKNSNSSSSIYTWNINLFMCFIFYAFIFL